MGHVWWLLGTSQVTAHRGADSRAGRVIKPRAVARGHTTPDARGLDHLFSNCKHLLLGFSAVRFLGPMVPLTPEGGLE